MTSPKIDNDNESVEEILRSTKRLRQGTLSHFIIPQAKSLESGKGVLSFFGFPREVRNLIYKFVFEDARLVIDEIDPYDDDAPLELYREGGMRVSILHLSKTFRQEALPIFNESSIKLVLMTDYCYFNDNQRFKILLGPWLHRIKTFELPAGLWVGDCQCETSRCWSWLNLQAIDFGTRLHHTSGISKPDISDVLKLAKQDVFWLGFVSDPTSDPRLTLEAVTGLSAGHVIRTVWCLNTELRRCIGWKYEFNVKTWKINSCQKVVFTRAPFDLEATTTPQDWKRNLKNWTISSVADQ